MTDRERAIAALERAGYIRCDDDGVNWVALTPAQRRVYQAIAELEAELGYAPTLRQIAERAGLRSTSTVHAHLQRLLQAGVIRRASRTVGYTTRGQAS